MSQPISVSVQMDAASFHDFAAFDLLRHRKAWHRPLAFTAILLASAGVCLSQVGQKDGAALHRPASADRRGGASGWPTSASTKGARATACCRPP